MRVLALDLSQRTGWALGSARDIVRCGLWHLPAPGDDIGAFGAAFENALIDMLEDEKPDRVVTAASLPPTAQTHAMTMECQVGLLMLTRTACYRHRVQHVVRAETTARKHVLGRGTFRSSEEAKAAVMAWAVGRGWSPPSHDAADALVMWWNEMSLAGAFARVAA